MKSWCASGVIALLVLLVYSGSSCISAPYGTATRNGATRDFTFFLFSDVHIGAENLKAEPPFTKADTRARIESQLQTMQRLVGQRWPEKPILAELNLGAIAAPRALIILGDVTDGHKDPAEQEDQRETLECLFPVRGVQFGERTVPVFACAGNHDGDPSGPVRRALAAYNRKLAEAGHFVAISSNGVHFAVNWSGVHFVCLNLCPADTTDVETPFKFGEPGPGSWNDPEGALSFLKDYLARHVGASGEPIVLMHHYGFDSFSLNDWNWWTPKQRRALYELLKDYNVAAFFHGHNHYAEHYRWPDPKRHAADLNFFFDGKLPAHPRQYDVLSCGNVCWVMRVRGDQLIAVHYQGAGWNSDQAAVFVKSLKPSTARP
jgi:cytolysin (calcineurin-like family phosphatase)